MIAEAAMEYLAAQGHGAVGLTLRVGHQVDAPNNLCTLFDESAPAATESNIVALDQVGLQVLVRDVEYRAARDRCRAIHQRLVGFGGESPRTSPRGGDLRRHAPIVIGRDERDRSEWTAHYPA